MIANTGQNRNQGYRRRINRTESVNDAVKRVRSTVGVVG
jgi:hypothetical protein